MLFDARITESEPWVVVRMIGDLDLATIPTARSVLHEAVRLLDGAEGICLDLSDLDFWDSLGLGLVVGTRRRARERDKGFAVAVGSGPVRDLLATAGLDGLLEVVTDVGALTAGSPGAHRG